MLKIRNVSAPKAGLVAGGSLLALGVMAMPLLQGEVVSSSSAIAATTVPASFAAPVGGNAGFVVSAIDWATGPDGDSTNCPNGMTTQLIAYNLGNGNRANLSPEETQRRAAYNAERSQACFFPEKAGPDPLHRTLVGSGANVYGLDLDGQDSQAGNRSSAGSCGQGDFRGVNGETGIDNQFYRAVGCSPGWQASGGKRLFGQEMLTGAWGILISLRGVENLMNDRDVRVGIYANGDPIQLSSARNPLSFASYNPDLDPRFRAETRGRIVNGILTTDPVNVRFHSITNTVRLERPMEGARLRMKVMPDGSLEGVMAGYAKVDDLYDFVVGYRNGKDANGGVSPQRRSNSGSAGSAGITCNGLYHAMKAMADGDRDPKTGACNSISHAYRIKAVPAFVVEKPVPVTTAVRKR